MGAINSYHMLIDGKSMSSTAVHLILPSLLADSCPALTLAVLILLCWPTTCQVRTRHSFRRVQTRGKRRGGLALPLCGANHHSIDRMAQRREATFLDDVSPEYRAEAPIRRPNTFVVWAGDIPLLRLVLRTQKKKVCEFMGPGRSVRVPPTHRASTARQPHNHCIVLHVSTKVYARRPPLKGRAGPRPP